MRKLGKKSSVWVLAFSQIGRKVSLVRGWLLLALLIGCVRQWHTPHLLMQESAIATSGRIDWADSNCLGPLRDPILGDRTRGDGVPPPRIINVGFPKCRSSTLHAFLLSSGAINSSHWFPCVSRAWGLRRWHCGICIREAVRGGQPPLATCGNYVGYTQMDFVNDGEDGCIFPQISYLNEIYEEAPGAIFLLPFRNVTAWIRSISGWYDLRRRIATNCEFLEYNFTRGMGKEDRELEHLFCRHVRHVRRFVSERPSLTLVEYAIDEDGVGDYLSSVLPHLNLNGSAYGHTNENLWLRRAEERETEKTGIVK